MDEVEVAAAVLATLEIMPLDRADLTPFVRSGAIREILGESVGRTESSLFKYALTEVDSRRLLYWKKLLRRDVQERRDYDLVLAGSARYPQRLAAVWDAPPVLFVKGELVDAAASVAIIGSRKTCPGALDMSREVATTLGASGIEIVSGLALGVDGAAHSGALEVSGRTSAILGTGIQVVFPEEHEELACSVSKSGALVSEFFPYAPRTKSSFLRRNGTIAAMSDLLVAVDAGQQSGSRQAVQRAVEYDRPVALWQPALGQENWALDLVKSKQAVFFSGASDLLDTMEGEVG